MSPETWRVIDRYQTEELLEQWGAWLRGGGAGIPSSLRVGAGGVVAADVTDEVAMTVDRAVAGLKGAQRRPEAGQRMYRVLSGLFVERMPSDVLARELAISPRRMYCIRRSAVGYVEIRLDSMKKNGVVFSCAS